MTPGWSKSGLVCPVSWWDIKTLCQWLGVPSFSVTATLQMPVNQYLATPRIVLTTSCHSYLFNLQARCVSLLAINNTHFLGHEYRPRQKKTCLLDGIGRSWDSNQFEHWWNYTDDLNCYTYLFLARCSALLRFWYILRVRINACSIAKILNTQMQQ